VLISAGICVDLKVRLKVNEKSPGIDFVNFRRNTKAVGNCRNVVSSERIIRKWYRTSSIPWHLSSVVIPRGTLSVLMIILIQILRIWPSDMFRMVIYHRHYHQHFYTHCANGTSKLYGFYECGSIQTRNTGEIIIGSGKTVSREKPVTAWIRPHKSQTRYPGIKRRPPPWKVRDWYLWFSGKQSLLNGRIEGWWIKKFLEKRRRSLLGGTISEFYILLTVHPEAIVGFQPTWRTFFTLFKYLFFHLYIFQATSAHHQEGTFVSTHPLV
jgi:hypothetical protein